MNIRPSNRENDLGETPPGRAVARASRPATPGQQGRAARVLRLGKACIFGLAALATACSTSDAGTDETSTDAGTSAEEDADVGRPPVCPPNGVSKGPWAIGMTRDGMILRWEACRQDVELGLVLVAEAPAGGSPTTATATQTAVTLKERHVAPLGGENAPDDIPGTVWMQEASLAGLSPGTCFRYELVADRSLGGRFCTSRPDGAKIHFLAIGDTNPLLGSATAKLLGFVAPLAPDFVLHGGDIQYYDSTLETWAGWFPVMQPMLSLGALQPALGNHELETDDELVDYSLRFFGRPKFGGAEQFYRFETGGVYFHLLDTEAPIDPGTPQGDWLVRSLEDASKAPNFRFSIVAMHRPLVTCGDSAQNDAARKAHASSFAQYKVPLVIQAHVHGYERFELDGITYVTSGGGGGLIGDMDENVSREECAMRKVSGGFFHALDVTVEDHKIRARAIDPTGADRDAFVLDVP